MQLYTKILLGMFVGAALGLTLGPKSSLLTKDTYEVALRSGAKVHLRLKRGEAAPLPIPDGVKLRLRVLETVTETLTDSAGAPSERPTWARVTLRYTEALSLGDRSGALAAALGKPKVGDAVEAWLAIENRPLDKGGFISTPTPVSGLGLTVLDWLVPVGKLFMRLITMVIVPLVFSSLLVGVASLGDVRKLGRLGGKTLGLYLLTTAVAVTIGLMVAHVVRPGRFIAEKDQAALVAEFDDQAGSKIAGAAKAPTPIDNVLAIVPENPVAALAQGDMLPTIFFAVIFGIALTLMGPGEGKMVVTFFDKVQNAMVIIIHMVMAVAPYGVAALIAQVVGTSGWSVLSALLVYSATVLLGLLLHVSLIYGALVRFVARLPIPDFLRAIRPAQLVAFSTSSSSATLPVTMECAEENLRMSNAVSSFVLPLGSTVNMDGTALYQGVAAIFIAQVFDISLDFWAQLGIVLTATMASIGAAGVPGAGMVTLAMVLTATGIPTVGVALILGMDRLLDMFRTMVNVTGDLAVASAVARSEGETLRPMGPEEDKADPEHGFESRLSGRAEPVDPD